MTNRFASGQNAISECDVCGFRYKLRSLRALIIKGKNTNILACQECWDPDHPQLHLGEFPVSDPQAIRNPRPDFTGYPESRARIQPVLSLTEPVTASWGTTGLVHHASVSPAGISCPALSLPSGHVAGGGGTANTRRLVFGWPPWATLGAPAAGAPLPLLDPLQATVASSAAPSKTPE